MSKNRKIATTRSTQLVQENLWPSVVGTQFPSVWQTRAGLVVEVPRPDFVRSTNGLVYSYVDSAASISWPEPTHFAVLRLFSGTAPPSVRFLSKENVLLGHQIATAISPACTFQAAIQSPNPISRAEITWQAEGGLVDVTYERSSELMSATKTTAIAIDARTCSGVVFAETSVLSGTGPTGADQLSMARMFIAGVAYKRNGQGVAKPVIPSDDELKNPNTKAIWEKCLDAAEKAKNNDVKSCQHFVLWYSDDAGKTPSEKPKMDSDWPYSEISKIKESWGPFKTPIAPQLLPIYLVTQFIQISTSAPVTNLYIFKYCGVR